MKNYSLIVLLSIIFSFNALAYDLSSGDVLHLEVYGEPELNLDVTVDSFGFIEYPFVGKIKVLGSPVDTVKNEILAKLKDGYFINPQVTVFVKEYRPFFVQGEVNSPGSYSYEVGLTVRKAIALAGGLTERASQKKMYLTKALDASQNQIKVSMDEKIAAGDVLQIKESFF
jgi:polysaccharide export outer membrane protein